MNEHIAIANYNTFKSKDPFPSIPASLLNSADIKSYVERAGIICPFHEKDLKSASYAARIAGKCKLWDDTSGTFLERELKSPGDKFTLKPNSIAFVGIEPTFRLPDYIALRFNLTITHVYRGLLLGTGPLIDPGFVGKISIPLHNLTSNDYSFSFNEPLIWIEFTKTSPIPDAEIVSESLTKVYEEARCRAYKPFPPDKTNKTLDYYIARALDGTRHEAVVSSIPWAIKETKDNAEAASKSARKIRNWTIGGAIGGLLAVLGTMATIIYGSWSIQGDYFREAVSRINDLEAKLYNTSKVTDKQLRQLENDINEISSKIEKINNSSGETLLKVPELESIKANKSSEQKN